MILRASRRLLLIFTKPTAVRQWPARQPLPRRYYTSQPIDSRRWYHNSLKIASLTGLVSGATAIAVYRPYIDLEVVPYTNRTHVVVLSPQSEREVSSSQLDEDRKKWAAESLIVDPLHPDSVRVRRITERIIRAAHCTLGIDSYHIAMLHGGSSVKDDDKTRRSPRRKASPLQPHARHLRDLEWEVILVKGQQTDAMATPAGKVVVFTGLLNALKTDAEIAFVVGHEIGHIIARHNAEIANQTWFPALFWVPFNRRMEIEADNIGIMLLGAAGFHPYTTLVALWNLTKANPKTIFETFVSPSPSYNTRSQNFLQPKVVEKAMELYKEATDQATYSKSAQ